MDDKELKGIIKEHIEEIRKNAESIKDCITIMEICGGHTNTIMKYGIRDEMPPNIKLISGPGCPVCVSSQYDIDCMIEIAKSVPTATYGDMLRVPGSSASLERLRGEGAKIFEVYSAVEVLKLKKEYDNIVFFGVGFETTAPMTAYLLKKGVAVYSAHKVVPPAMNLLVKEGNIDGFIDPGHVSTVIGADAYKHINVPQAIAGFTPERVLRAINVLVRLIKNKENTVINAYPEAVSDKGNTKIQDLLKEVFIVKESEWRGLGIIERSGLEVKEDKLNAKMIYKGLIKKVPKPKKTACRCGDILKGKITPEECPLYKKRCTPENPQGACMVSSEGSCQIYYNNIC